MSADMLVVGSGRDTFRDTFLLKAEMGVALLIHEPFRGRDFLDEVLGDPLPRFHSRASFHSKPRQLDAKAVARRKRQKAAKQARKITRARA